MPPKKLKIKKVTTKRSMAVQGFNIQGSDNLIKGATVVDNTAEIGNAEEELIVQGFNLPESSKNNILEDTLVKDNKIIEISYESDDEEITEWQNIHPSFTLKLVQSWQLFGFTVDQCRDWINTSPPNQQEQAIQEPLYYVWLKDLKGYTPENFLNESNEQKLRTEYQQLQMQVKPILKHVIGKGGYGEVYYGEWKLQEVAVKKLYLSPHNTSESELKSIQREIDILKNLRNRHIIQYYGTYSDDQEILIIMDYAENGTLANFINDNKDKEHDWSFNTGLIKQMTLGLVYIHHENIIHRDLKSMNILLANNYQAKISDFGLAKTKDISSSRSKDIKGTLRWMAPELLKGKKHSEQSDIYSLGMVIWEIAAKSTIPFRDIDNSSLYFHIIKNGKETIPVGTPQNIHNIIQQCWKDDLDERITLKGILEEIGVDKLSLQVIFTSQLPEPSNFIDFQNSTNGQILNSKQDNVSKSVEFNISNLEELREQNEQLTTEEVLNHGNYEELIKTDELVEKQKELNIINSELQSLYLSYESLKSKPRIEQLINRNKKKEIKGKIASYLSQVEKLTSEIEEKKKMIELSSLENEAEELSLQTHQEISRK
jgi:serine/threonine protein kinase